MIQFDQVIFGEKECDLYQSIIVMSTLRILTNKQVCRTETITLSVIYETFIHFIYYIARSAHGQDEANPVV